MPSPPQRRTVTTTASTRFTAAVWALGAAGSAAVALSSYRVGALPTTLLGHPPLTPLSAVAGRAISAGGLTALTVAWLALWRLLRGLPAPGRQVRTVRLLRRIGVTWAAPMLAALPVQSRDLWLYLGQAQVARHGLDPYRVGPGGVPGIFAAQVSSRWQHAPSPYGPLWTLLGEGSADVTGGHLVLGVLALRTWAALGLALLACTVPGLAARFAGRPDIALWLVVVNPVVLVVVLGGGHNDLLMIGLVAAGLGAALSARPARWALPLAGALVASAALIKAPAALALPFLVPLRLCGAAGTCAPAPPRLLVAAYGRVLLGAVAAGGVITVGCGQSLGWVGQLGRSPNDVYGWVSLVNPVIFAVRLAGGSPGGPLDPGSAVVRSTDLAAAGLTLVLAAVGWWRAHLDRPALWLAVTFVAAVLLAPTIRPWYACWPLVLVAVALRPGRWVLAAVAVSLVCTFGNGPGGKSALSSPGEAVVAAVAVSGVVLALCLPVLRSGRAQRTSSATG